MAGESTNRNAKDAGALPLTLSIRFDKKISPFSLSSASYKFLNCEQTNSLDIALSSVMRRRRLTSTGSNEIFNLYVNADLELHPQNKNRRILKLRNSALKRLWKSVEKYNMLLLSLLRIFLPLLFEIEFEL